MPSSPITQRSAFRRSARLRQTRLARDRRIKQLRNTPAWEEELEDELEELDVVENIDSYQYFNDYKPRRCSSCFGYGSDWLRQSRTHNLDEAVERVERKMGAIESEFVALEAWRVTDWLEHAGR